MFLDYSVDSFDVYPGIMGDILAARYRERVMGESHEASERLTGEFKDPYFRLLRSLEHNFNPSCLMSPGAVGPLEGALVTSLICLASVTQLVTGCQLDSILEASPS